MSKPDALQFRGVWKSYPRPGGGELHALRDVAIRVAPGRKIAILGRSGSGKSTFLHLAAGIDEPSRGEVRWHGGDRHHRGVASTDPFLSPLASWGWRPPRFPAIVGLYRPMTLGAEEDARGTIHRTGPAWNELHVPLAPAPVEEEFSEDHTPDDFTDAADSWRDP